MVAVPRGVALFVAGLLPILGMVACGPSQAPAATTDAGVDAGVVKTPDSGPPKTGGFDANDFLPPPDGGSGDAGAEDAGMHDAGPQDAGRHDAGNEDAGRPDAAGEPDGGSRSDAGEGDAGPMDAGRMGRDAGHVDAGCVPWTDQFICENKGKKCGSYMITDNCSGQRDVSCFNACPQSLASGDFLLDGVTSDGYVVVTDKSSGDVSVVSPSSSPASLTTISAHGPSPVVEVSNAEVFIWYVTSDAGTPLPVGTLYTWDSVDKANGPVDGGTLVSAGLASPSVGELVYVGGVNESTMTGTIVGAGTDLTSPKSILTNVYLPPLHENLSSVAAFTDYGLVLEHRSSTSANTTLTTLNASSTPLWAASDIGLQVAGPYWADLQGNDVTWLGPSNVLLQSPPHLRTTATTIASNVTPVTLGTENATAWISGDSSTIAYVSNQMLYAAMQGPPVASISLDTGVAAVLGLDPAGDTVLYAKSLNAGSSCSDLWVSTTAASGTSTQVGSGTCALYGSVRFTQLGQSLVYIDGPSNGSGTVVSFDLTGTLPSQTLGNGGATSITIADGSIVVFTDSVIPSNTGGVPSTVSVEQADVSGTDYATVAGPVDGNFVVTNATGTESLIYTVSSTTVGSSQTKGLYIVPLP